MSAMARAACGVMVLSLLAVAPSAGQEASATVAVAPAAEALTFARIGGGVVLVEEYRDGMVRGLNLTCALGRVVGDPIDVFLAEGYRSLRALLANAGAECRLVSKVEDLTIPVDLRGRHIAAGANFPEHAGEAEVEEGPFLFAKLVEPTAFDATVPAGDGLLDYEVELAWVTLEPLRKGEEPAWMGLILCNDYTDRAALLRHLDPWDVASAQGFTTGKSFPGYLPVGNLFVIPADHRTFAAERQLRLWVNGELRQEAAVSQAVWDFDEMLEQVWRWQDRRWRHGDGEVSLLGEQDVIGSRTMLMGGTPSGTAFQGIPRGAQLSGALSWLAGGWGRPLTAHVFDSYIDAARGERRFLQPGDRVVVHVDRLGVIDNQIDGGAPAGH
jgi:2,4-didehydro-3-deoxy-L-rhamnonate hydrolase